MYSLVNVMFSCTVKKQMYVGGWIEKKREKGEGRGGGGRNVRARESEKGKAQIITQIDN